jgi:hypothetical protein
MIKWIFILVASLAMVFVMALFIPASNFVVHQFGAWPLTFPMVAFVLLCLVGHKAIE